MTVFAGPPSRILKEDDTVVFAIPKRLRRGDWPAEMTYSVNHDHLGNTDGSNGAIFDVIECWGSSPAEVTVHNGYDRGSTLAPSTERK